MVRRSRRSNRRNNNQRPRWDPTLYCIENLALATADTPSNNTILTITSPSQPYLFRLTDFHASILSGANAALNLFVVRRVPSGYTAPTSVTIATGGSTFIDTIDVIAYGMILSTAGSTSEQEVVMTYLRRTITLYQGDSVVVQAVPNVACVGQTYSVFGSYSVASI